MLFNDSTAWRGLTSVTAAVLFPIEIFCCELCRSTRTEEGFLSVGRVSDREAGDLQVAVISFAFGDQIPSGAPQRIYT